MVELVVAQTERLPVKKPLNFAERESKELVVAFSGAIGCGLSDIVDQASTVLKGFGYEVHTLKISDFIKQTGAKEKRATGEPYLTADDLSSIAANSSKKYQLLQTAGNNLREDYSLDILAELAVGHIATLRAEKHPSVEIKDIVPTKVAYLIDQLKHPAEVQLFRKVYGNLFYLIGVFASETQRTANLRKTLPAYETFDAMNRDRHEEDTHGQKLDKTLKLADLFLRNNQANRQSVQAQITRFFKLVHREEIFSPTKDEYAMYAAFAAGMRSACLSRQVGAAITDGKGNLIATGCNDVPKGGGGLYADEDREHDKRCVRIEDAKCHNDHRKQMLTGEIGVILSGAGLPPDKIGEVTKRIRETTAIHSILEYSRSVHAEMDAITTVARVGGASVAGGSLYSTTYPCHNCARHIISAGITRVFYIEPYEKSLALDLHKDAIDGDVDEHGMPKAEESTLPLKVRFMHFEGVAPRQYQNMFLALEERKHDGKAVSVEHGGTRKSLVQYLDSYIDLETKVVAKLEERGLL